MLSINVDTTRSQLTYQQALNKPVNKLQWVLRGVGFAAVFACYLVYLVIYFIPSDRTPFAIQTPTMSIGMVFNALGTLFMFILFGWNLIYLLFAYAEIRSPLYKRRFFWFSIFTGIVVFTTILHLLFGQDINHLSRLLSYLDSTHMSAISMLCRRILANLYVYSLVFIFFPKEIDNADEYGLTAYTQF